MAGAEGSSVGVCVVVSVSLLGSLFISPGFGPWLSVAVALGSKVSCASVGCKELLGVSSGPVGTFSKAGSSFLGSPAGFLLITFLMTVLFLCGPESDMKNRALLELIRACLVPLGQELHPSLHELSTKTAKTVESQTSQTHSSRRSVGKVSKG